MSVLFSGIAIHQPKLNWLTSTAFYQVFIGRITSPPAHTVTEGMWQPNVYFRRGKNAGILVIGLEQET